jgi:outer membrane protein, heavy metal efflux system
MRTASWIVMATALSVPAAGARAQTTVRLSQDEAVERALQASPLVVRTDRERDVVAATRVGAGVLLPANPVVTAVGGHRRDTSKSVPPAVGPEWGVRVEQMIEIAGQRGTRLHEADRAIAVATARQRLARVDTRAEARSAYVMLQVARAQAEAAAKRLEIGDQLLRAAQARVRAGASSDVELHLAEVERARLEHDRVEADLAAAEAERALGRLVAMAPGTRLETTTPLAPPPAMTADVQRLTADALARRQERRVVGAAEEHIDAVVKRLKREVVPNPTLFLDVGTAQPQQLYVGGGVALPLPLWRRNQGELAQARAERRRLEDEDRLLQREIALEVAAAVRALEARQAEAQLWSERVVPSAEANVELVRQGWLGGKFDLFRVVQVTREAAEARRRQLEVLGDLWRARIELERVTGQTS